MHGMQYVAKSSQPRIRPIWVLCFALFVGSLSVAQWKDFSGHEQSVDRLHGDIVVLNYWATWCKPCVDELPILSEIQQKYGLYSVRVVGVSTDIEVDPQAILKFAASKGVEFSIWLGGNIEHMKASGLEGKLPATVIYDREGRIVERLEGKIQKKQLEDILDRMIAEEQATADARSTIFHDHTRIAQAQTSPTQRKKRPRLNESSLVPS